MKYFKFAIEQFEFKYLFYTVYDNIMFVYCPNCGRVEELHLTKKYNVSFYKNNYKCNCNIYMNNFRWCNSKNKYYETLDVKGWFAEFENNDGKLKFNVYEVIASFFSDNCRLERYPDFTFNKIISYDLNENTIKSKLFYLNNNICVGQYFKYVKSIYCGVEYNIIEESFKELKYTKYEKYIKPSIDIDYICKNLNYSTLNRSFFESILLFDKYSIVYKLYISGYKKIIRNKVFENIFKDKISYKSTSFYCTSDCIKSGKVLNWNSEILIKFFRNVDINIIDRINNNREYINVIDIYYVKKLLKYNIPVTLDNINIYKCNRIETLINFALNENINCSKIFKYIRNKSKLYKYLNVLCDEYYDYLYMIKSIYKNIENSMIFPSDIKIAHDKTVILYKKIKDEIKIDKFKKVVKKYKNMNYINNEYYIFPIQTINQLSKEANQLHNCSMSYIDRIIDNKSMIFVMHKNSELNKAFIMFEYNPINKNIVQIHGVNNSNVDDSIKDVCIEFVNNIVINNIA